MHPGPEWGSETYALPIKGKATNTTPRSPIRRNNMESSSETSLPNPVKVA